MSRPQPGRSGTLSCWASSALARSCLCETDWRYKGSPSSCSDAFLFGNHPWGQAHIKTQRYRWCTHTVSAHINSGPVSPQHRESRFPVCFTDFSLAACVGSKMRRSCSHSCWERAEVRVWYWCHMEAATVSWNTVTVAVNHRKEPHVFPLSHHSELLFFFLLYKHKWDTFNYSTVSWVKLCVLENTSNIFPTFTWADNPRYVHKDSIFIQISFI